MIDFDKKAHIYFIGIGGVSMSGLYHIRLRYERKRVDKGT